MDEENMTWQDRWEQAAMSQRAEFESMTPDELIAYVKGGHIGGYYNVWYVIAAKCALEQAGWLLLDAGTRATDDLVRYHAIAALGQMLGLKEDDLRIHASKFAEFPVPEASLEPLRKLLLERIGPEKT